MELTVNGEDRQVPDGTSAQALLELLGLPDKGVAIAVNGAVHPRSAWDAALPSYADVEVLTAVQGG
ncbi:Thiamine biosynthesis protein ThiS OS=Tsukamurella paurometabola (strain ATCC 8368 / DSM / CCUG 35730 / CIP 100753 / JCM 10117 / KCTC 9821 / NBRC 16120/ NCIMB 702349 / NCTC 13040) OX=521096 GN=Tpau_3747 PE=4 SV=1 [Tsukamurella paurometabola]|uniref:Thiamine biosynthesis protein ThiS n=1 Tax=Tsukamurella paurometabola (strain ATCC 8368 / DSM 20162 / CCUG 35730 / CIP 100753 / JCM 10117 / KCTC 9821 / NBRC 16120 / NCIMB 702349 / NCTC 13040) TaxID=521096 RepID=D5UYM2_TSUPD|nr:sulfur carrier protein ThiS [Tsukamurella paurometabola]ADG80325.1 thiamine biosynthesis protein ThiS [Tsukamurella paurometabola DSM 20162]SUP39255.1 sulfur carrier protein ThiS [Tsukamurella paurometabola]